MLKPEQIYNGVVYDSMEEVWIAMWLDEVKEAGFIDQWDRKVQSFPITSGLSIEYVKKTQLKTKIKEETKSQIILRPSEYTPDFSISWKSLWNPFAIELGNAMRYKQKIEHPLISHDKGVGCFSIIEVKPEWDQNNMERLFVNNQKIVWRLHNTFVNLVEPIAFFKKTFMPQKAMSYFRYKKAPTGKNKGIKIAGDWKVDYGPKTLKQFLDESVK